MGCKKIAETIYFKKNQSRETSFLCLFPPALVHSSFQTSWCNQSVSVSKPGKNEKNQTAVHDY